MSRLNKVCGSTPRANPLPFFIAALTENVKCMAPFTHTYVVQTFESFSAAMRSFAQEKKCRQAPEIDALVRDRKVFAWCHKIN